jgi:hypothetical protein
MASVHIPYTVERDENGWWSAHAMLTWQGGGRGGANGQGRTEDEAIADLHEALEGVLEVYGLRQQAVRPMILDVA